MPHRNTKWSLSGLRLINLMKLAFCAAIVSTLTLHGSAAKAKLQCKPLFGHFESRVNLAPDFCTSPVAFCTEGTVIGGLQGVFKLTVESFVPVADISTHADSPVSFFVGESVITEKNSGDVLVGTDTGALNLANGQIATLITFTAGTGGFAGATGQIVVSGAADFATGRNIGDYRGEVCTP